MNENEAAPGDPSGTGPPEKMLQVKAARIGTFRVDDAA
jgi:hypothetical protein